jgi:hypothetical protein
MQIFLRKFAMNFLMNGTYHVGVMGILLVGGWFVLTGRTEHLAAQFVERLDLCRQSLCLHRAPRRVGHRVPIEKVPSTEKVS